MSRIRDIINDARITLNDPDESRWKNNVIYSFLNEALNEISKKTYMLRTSSDIYMLKGVSVYSLPTDTLKMHIAMYDNREIPLIGRSAFTVNTTETNNHGSRRRRHGVNTNSDFGLHDRVGYDWITVEGDDVLAIVYDEEGVHNFRVYPIPTKEEIIVESSEQFGFISGISAPSTVDLDSNQETGIATGLSDTNYVTVIRSFKHPKVNNVDDVLLFPEFCDSAIKHYITYKSFRTDNSELNRDFGNEEYRIFMEMMKDVLKMSSKQFITASHHRSRYRVIS